MKNPWMPIYWADYLADTMHFTTVEHGAYLLLIAHYWCNGGLPKSDAELARIVGVSHQKWSKMRGHIAEKFDKQWQHKRIEQELAKALTLQERGRENDRRYREKRRTSRRRNVPVVPAHNYNYNYKESKSQNGKLAGTGSAGYVASPQSEEFKKWKAWAFEKKTALWRELQQREIEGRPFNFETQWPPH